MNKKKITLLLVSSSISFTLIGSASWIIAKSIIESTTISSNKISEVDYFSLIKYNDESGTSSNTYEVDKNDRLSMYLEKNPSKDGYYFDGWYDFNTKEPINENKVIDTNIAVYPKYTEITSTNQPTSSIDGVTVTPGTSGAGQVVINVTDDKLGSGSTLDVPYTEGVPSCDTSNVNASGTTTSFGDEDKATAKIVLQNDLVIESGATFNLGAQVGYSKGTGPNVINGAISGNYTTLDLNGHNIIVYGTFKAYGLVMNSRIGRGMIYVAGGGVVITPFCIADFGGGGNLVHDYTYSYAPFSTYSTPYLSCLSIFECGGFLQGISSLNASSSNYPTDMYFIGNSSSYLIQMDGGYVIDKPSDYRSIALGMSNYVPSTYREGLVFTNKLDLNEYILPDKITYKSQWENTKVNVTINSLNLKIDVVISVNASMSYVEFPVSSFYDLEFYGCKVNIKQIFEVNPYATVYLDSNSTLNFQKSGTSKIQGGIGTRNYINYGSPSLAYPGSNFLNSYINNVLLDKNHPGTVTIDGDLSFETNVTTDDTLKYEIGGYINLSSAALASLRVALDNGCGINVYESSTIIGHTSRSGVSTTIGIASKDAIYAKIPNMYYNYPLISNNVAYFTVNNELKAGEYDATTGLINIDSTYYSFVYSSTYYLPYGVTTKVKLSTPKPENNIGNRINNTAGTWQVCSYNSSNGIITINSNYYVFYSGAYIRVNSNSSSTTYFSDAITNQKIYTSGISNTNEKYDRWKFAQHGCTSRESTTLVFDSNTKTWKHG